VQLDRCACVKPIRNVPFLLLLPRYRLAISIAAISITFGFGLWPFNFVSSNDVAFDADHRGYRFNQSSEQGDSHRRGLAYTEGPLRFESSRNLAILIEATPTRIPNGLGTLLEFHDGRAQAPLLIAQWQEHLVIRSRRDNEQRNRPYSEVGHRHCLVVGSKVSLLISDDGTSTTIYVNGVEAVVKPSFALLDPSSIRSRIAIGASADGEQPWIGLLSRIAVFNRAMKPEDLGDAALPPILTYDFARESGRRLSNPFAPQGSLLLPDRFLPIERKPFASLSSWDPRRRGLVIDALLNLFGFMPIGIVFFAFLRQRMNWLFGTILATIALGALSSYGIEWAQQFLPSRNPSAFDLLANTLGGLLGALSGALFDHRINSAAVSDKT